MKNIKAMCTVGNSVINVVYNDGSAIAELWEDGKVVQTNTLTADRFDYNEWLKERQFEDSIGFCKLLLF